MTYCGQCLKARQRATSTAWYFVPKNPPQAFLTQYGATVRLVAKDKPAAVTEAAPIWSDLQSMRAASGESSARPHSMAWLVDSWRASDWYCHEITATTRRGYASCLTAIEQGFDNRNIRNITVRDLVVFLEQYRDRPTRRGHMRVVLRNLFTHALQLGLVERNPVEGVRLSRVRQERANPTVLWDQGFVDAFAAEAIKRNRPEAAGLVRLMWDVGQRPTDLLNLTVLNDIERARLERGRAIEGLGYDPAKGVIRGWQSKTRSLVSIPLDQPTNALLRKISGVSGHVFVNSRTGRAFTLNQFDRLFQRVALAIGATKTRFGHGRHSCIVRLYRAGCSDSEVTSITGHASPEITKQRYWVADNEQAQAAKVRRREHEGSME